MDIKELQVNLQKQSQQNHPWEYARFFVVNDLIHTYLGKEKAIWVDVGCGDVFFLHQLSQKYKGAFVAVDTAFDAEMIARLSAKYSDMKIDFYSNIDAVNLHGAKAKVVFLMDVIEHIPDAEAFLKNLRNADFVDDETLFVITVPAYQFLFSQHDVWLDHIQRYSLKDLKIVTQQAKLQELKSGYFFFSLFLVRCLSVAIEKIRKKKNLQSGIGGWNAATLLTKLFIFALKADYWLCGKMLRKIGLRLPGLSAYTICKWTRK